MLLNFQLIDWKQVEIQSLIGHAQKFQSNEWNVVQNPNQLLRDWKWTKSNQMNGMLFESNQMNGMFVEIPIQLS